MPAISGKFSLACFFDQLRRGQFLQFGDVNIAALLDRLIIARERYPFRRHQPARQFPRPAIMAPLQPPTEPRSRLTFGGPNRWVSYCQRRAGPRCCVRPVFAVLKSDMTRLGCKGWRGRGLRSRKVEESKCQRVNGHSSTFRLFDFSTLRLVDSVRATRVSRKNPMRNVAICEGSCTAEIDPPSALLVVVSRSRCGMRRGETIDGSSDDFRWETNAAEGMADDCPAR